jgi:hypothetical protein
MKLLLAAACVSLLGVGAAAAAEDQNATGKAQSEYPGTSQPGTIAAPMGKPDSGSKSAKQKQSAPGVNSNAGTTSDP